MEAKLLESSREHEAKDHRLADLETRLLGAIQTNHLKVCPHTTQARFRTTLQPCWCGVCRPAP